MVALLASTFALKLLEMNSKRDSYLVVFMAFFLSLLLALFDQSIRSALFMAICLLLSTAALIGLHGQELNTVSGVRCEVHQYYCYRLFHLWY